MKDGIAGGYLRCIATDATDLLTQVDMTQNGPTDRQTDNAIPKIRLRTRRDSYLYINA